MEQMIQKMLHDYGRDMVIHHGVDRGRVRAFLQADTGKVDRLTDLQPGILGLENRRRYIYIGPTVPAMQQGDELEADGTFYHVRSVQTIYGGERPVYIWAMCVEKGERCPWEKNG